MRRAAARSRDTRHADARASACVRLLERSKNGASSGDAQEARRAFEEELVQDPTNANAAYELAEMDRQVGELERACTLFEQAIVHYPAFEHARIGLAKMLIALDRPAEALSHLKVALAANPQSDVAYYQVARAYRALGDTVAQQTAVAEYTRLHALAAQRTSACR